MDKIIPEITLFKKKKFIGKSLKMSIINNKTGLLWLDFMPQKKFILNTIDENLYSVNLYEEGYFKMFDPNKEFTKLALIEVNNFDEILDGFETFEIETGLYAKFNYVGLSTDNTVFEYIYTKWLPNSGYSLDDRPHFEVLGSKYKNNEITSEEEIWIPIKPNI